VDALTAGLRRLEYRGYDSAGLSVDGAGSCGPLVFRETGKVDALCTLIDSTAAAAGLDWAAEVESHAGIAHTRWATHGKPLPHNAHPHVSDGERTFVVVHNGIITNYAALREMLQRRGYEFESETDTEVIPKLAKCLYDALPEPAGGGARISFLHLVQLVVRELEGAYALIFKSRLYPGELVAAKRGSPLLLAIRDPLAGAEGLPPATAAEAEAPPTLTSRPRPGQRRRADQVEFFLASDASAVIEHTKKVMVLEDDDLVHLAGGCARHQPLTPAHSLPRRPAPTRCTGWRAATRRSAAASSSRSW